MSRMNKGSFAAAVAVLTLITVYCCAGTVMSRTGLSAEEVEAYYSVKEDALVESVREFLNREGYTNSGVMLTRVVEADGSREYTLTVHHGKIDNMCEADRELLMGELEKIVFEDESSSFSHEFLINN